MALLRHMVRSASELNGRFHPARHRALPRQDCSGGFLDSSGDLDCLATDDANFGLTVLVGSQPRDVLSNHKIIAAAGLERNELHEPISLFVRLSQFPPGKPRSRHAWKSRSDGHQRGRRTYCTSRPEPVRGKHLAPLGHANGRSRASFTAPRRIRLTNGLLKMMADGTIALTSDPDAVTKTTGIGFPSQMARTASVPVPSARW